MFEFSKIGDFYDNIFVQKVTIWILITTLYLRLESFCRKQWFIIPVTVTVSDRLFYIHAIQHRLGHCVFRRRIRFDRNNRKRLLCRIPRDNIGGFLAFIRVCFGRPWDDGAAGISGFRRFFGAARGTYGRRTSRGVRRLSRHRRRWRFSASSRARAAPARRCRRSFFETPFQ